MFLSALLLLCSRVAGVAGPPAALRSGGYGWRRYWHAAWSKMGMAWHRMCPRHYDWDDDSGPEL